MAKRFCDTNIWDEDWFICMPPTYKLLWFWIKDKCDHAGVWKPNLKNFIALNGEVDIDKALEFFNDEEKTRIIKLDNGKFFLPGFFVFQYGPKLSLGNQVHKSINELLIANNINVSLIRGLTEVKEKLERPLPEVKAGVKDKDIDKDKDKKEEGEKFKSLMETFEVARKLFPGTKNGLDTEFNNFSKKHKDWKNVVPILTEKINNQILVRAKKISRGEFVPPWKNFSTWINNRCWEEEIGQGAGVSAGVMAGDIKERMKPKEDKY